MIKDYAANHKKYSAKRTRGLANAVAKCGEFLNDPEVSVYAHIFSYFFIQIRFYKT